MRTTFDNTIGQISNNKCLLQQKPNAEKMIKDIADVGLKIIFTSVYFTEKQGNNMHYEYEQNTFYKTLASTELTPVLLSSKTAEQLLQYGMGLICLPRNYPEDDAKRNDDVVEFINKIKKYQPKLVCFNGKEAARIFTGKLNTKDIETGLLPETIGTTQFFVAPSTGYMAQKYFDEKVWQQLKQFTD